MTKGKTCLKKGCRRKPDPDKMYIHHRGDKVEIIVEGVGSNWTYQYGCCGPTHYREYMTAESKWGKPYSPLPTPEQPAPTE